jgi:hypothetical protein
MTIYLNLILDTFPFFTEKHPFASFKIFLIFFDDSVYPDRGSRCQRLIKRGSPSLKGNIGLHWHICEAVWEWYSFALSQQTSC